MKTAHVGTIQRLHTKSNVHNNAVDPSCRLLMYVVLLCLALAGSLVDSNMPSSSAFASENTRADLPVMKSPLPIPPPKAQPQHDDFSIAWKPTSSTTPPSFRVSDFSPLRAEKHNPFDDVCQEKSHDQNAITTAQPALSFLAERGKDPFSKMPNERPSKRKRKRSNWGPREREKKGI